MAVTINVGGGPQAARLSIQSNDPAGVKHLIISWRGAAPAWLIPASVIETQASAERSFERVVQLLYPGGLGVEPPHLASVDSESPSVHVSVHESKPIQIQLPATFTRASYAWSVKLLVRVDPPPTGHSGEVLARCQLGIRSRAGVETVTLPVSVSFRSSALMSEAGPVLFVVGRGANDSKQERRVKLPPAISAEDVDASDLPEWLACSVSSGPGRDRFLHLVMNGRPDSALTSAVIRQKRDKEGRVKDLLSVFVCLVDS